MCYATISCLSLFTIWLMKNFDFRIEALKFFAYRETVICGSIINQHNFSKTLCLVQKAFNTLIQPFFSIINSNNHTYFHFTIVHLINPPPQSPPT